ncbi:fucose permease [Mucilaginibacter yixingensis]|uniref:Fucose permease n=1 Tax=Mucilaginibacter yixingensis TaxID=1295612 RepID=A0A2T5JEZ3_9SPHI|nr:MFS transporter [Mucilaginibacter yixingensis]PTR00906.1 fucose permease [Mucilaginibacter yixingensis]
MSHEAVIKYNSPRKARIASTVFFFISGFGYSAWASRIPSIQQHLHMNEAQLGTVLFAMPVGLMCTMPITGKLLGRYSSRSIMVTGALVYAIMLGLLGFVNQQWQLAIILFFFGSSRNLFNLSLNAQSVSLQSLYSKSILTAFHGVWSLAGFAGAALGYLMVLFNITPQWHLPAVCISMIASSLIFFPDTLYHRPVAVQQKKPVFSLPDKFLLKFSLICFACMACENTMYDWSGIYFEKALHTTKQGATAAFVFYMVAMTLSRFAGDKLVTRLGIKTILKYSGWFILVGLAIAVAFPYPLTAGLGFVFTGAGVSCVVPLVFSMAGKSKTMGSATALAAISTIGYLGFLVVPPLVGYVAQAAGLRVAFGIIAALGGLIVWMVGKIPNQD